MKDVREHRAGIVSQEGSRDLAARVDTLVAEAHRRFYYDLEDMRVLGEEAYDLASRPGADGVRYERGMAGALSVFAARLLTMDESREAYEQSLAGIGLLDPGVPDVYRTRLIITLAQALFYSGDYAEGVSQADYALRLAREFNDRENESRVLAALSGMHIFLEHQEMALGLMERAVELSRDIGYAPMLMMQLNNMAWMFLGYGDAVRSLGAAQESLDICRREACTGFEPAVTDTVATAYMDLGRLDEAEELARRTIRMIHVRSDGASDVASARQRLALIHAARGRLEEAIAEAELSLAVKASLDKRMDMTDLHRMLAGFYEQSGRYDLALGHMKAFYELEKERMDHKVDNRLAILRVQYQSESLKKDAEIYRLRAIALESEVEERRLDQIRLEVETSQDPATGLFNRRHLPVLRDRLHALNSEGIPVSLMMLDIDRFKDVNDTYGHLVGDQVIAVIAQHLKAGARQDDTVVRFGGEEFLVFLPGTDAAAAMAAAERIRRAVAEHPVACGGGVIRFSVSMGVATSGGTRGEDLRDLIDRADRALYRAKEGGRNRSEAA